MTQNADGEARLSKVRQVCGSRRAFAVYAICLFITIATMVASIISSLLISINAREKLVEHLGLCTMGLMLMSIPIIMRNKYHFHIPPFIQMVVAGLIFAHFVLGEVYRFYDYVFLFDKILHITGGFLMVTCGFSIVYGFSGTEDENNASPIELSPFFAAVFSFCFALALLTLWEIFEFMLDSIWGFNMQRWQDNSTILYAQIEIDGAVKNIAANPKQDSGLIDTMTDLIVGTIGAAVVSILGGLRFKKDPHITKKFLIVRNKPENK